MLTLKNTFELYIESLLTFEIKFLDYAQVIQCSSIIKAVYSWKLENADAEWNYSMEVCTTLENPQQVQVTCPLNPNKEGIFFMPVRPN